MNTQTYAIVVYTITTLLLLAFSSLIWRRGWSSNVRLVAFAAALVILNIPLTLFGVLSGSALVAALLISLSEELLRGYVIIRDGPVSKLFPKAIVLSAPFALAETSNWLAGEKSRDALSGLGFSGIEYLGLDVLYIVGEYATGLLFHGIFAVMWILVLRSHHGPASFWMAFCLPFGCHAMLDFAVISMAG